MSFSNSKIIKPGASPEQYLASAGERGSAEFVMSSTQLRSFGRCPSRWLKGYNPPISEAMEHGSQLDCYVLTPERWEKRYAVEPATYEKTVMECPDCGSRTDSKKCRACGTDRKEIRIKQAWNRNATECREWLIAQGHGIEPVSASEFEEISRAQERLQNDEIISAFLAASDRQVWVCGIYHDEDTGLDIPVQCLIDLAPRADTEFSSCLGDLKTTRSAALIPWARHCYEMGYYIQAAFNTDLYVAATGEDRNTFCFILSENYPPFEPARRMLSQDFMDPGRAEYKRLLGLYARCLKSGRWPSYDDTDESCQGWSLVEASPWMANAEQFAPKFELPETEDEPISADIVP